VSPSASPSRRLFGLKPSASGSFAPPRDIAAAKECTVRRVAPRRGRMAKAIR
jgi:hypothetical protein